MANLHAQAPAPVQATTPASVRSGDLRPADVQRIAAAIEAEVAPSTHTTFASVAAGRVVLVVAQMVGHLGIQRGLQDLFGLRAQQATLTGQRDPTIGRRLDQLLSQASHVRRPHRDRQQRR